MSKVLTGVIAALVVAGIGGLSYWAGTRNADSKPATAAAPAKGLAPAGVVIEASKVAVVNMPQALSAVGSLRSDETVILRPEVAGRVSQILFREGERVAKDAVLLKLDDSVQKADADRARANFTLSKTKHDRAVDLRNKGFVSTQALDESENSVKVAKADAELMEARLSKTTIRAPFSGTIGLRQVSVGDYV